MNNEEIQLKTISKELIVVEVPSSRDGKHEVVFNKTTGECSCTCEDFFYRKRLCKHIRQAKEFLKELGIICNCDKVFRGNIDVTVEDLETLKQLAELINIKDNLLSLREENNLVNDECVKDALKSINTLLSINRLSA